MRRFKANHLLRNGGAFRKLGLSESARFAIYGQRMRLQDKLGFKTFAVVIDKTKAGPPPARCAGIVAIGVVIAAIMTSQDSEGWLIGLVVSIVSVVLAAVLWSSRRL